VRHSNFTNLKDVSTSSGDNNKEQSPFVKWVKIHYFRNLGIQKMVMLYPSPPNSPQPEEAQVIILLSNTEKSISCCTGRSAASFIRELKESVFAMCSVTQGRREKQEQPWRYVGSFRNTREGTG